MTAQLSLSDRQVCTIDDVLSLPNDGHRYEIIDGSALMSPAPPVEHQIAGDRLAGVLLAAAPDTIEVITAIGVDVTARVELTGPDAPVVVMSVLDQGVFRETGTVRAGESVGVDVPFPVELRPAEPVGPRHRRG